MNQSGAVGRRRYDPQDMALRGRIGAFTLHATHDPRETTAKARAAFAERFEREVDPNGELPEEERQRRAYYAKKAYYAKLARRRAVKRRPWQLPPQVSETPEQTPPDQAA